MKEATGEMTTTVIVIIGLVGVLALGYWVWGVIQTRIENEVNENFGDETAYVETIHCSYDI